MAKLATADGGGLRIEDKGNGTCSVTYTPSGTTTPTLTTTADNGDVAQFKIDLPDFGE